MTLLYRVRTLLSSSNSMTFHVVFRDPKFRLFFYFIQFYIQTQTLVSTKMCHLCCLITCLYCTLSLLWHLQYKLIYWNITLISMTFQDRQSQSFHDFPGLVIFDGFFLPNFMFWPFGNTVYMQWIFFLLSKLLTVSGEKWRFVCAV